jgi:hypothetical protein
MGTLITKDGFRITATVETIIGTCRVISAERDASGQIILEYGDDGTEICWDTAEQIKRDGSPVYQTEDGEEYLERDLELIDDDDDDAFCGGCGRYGPVCSRDPCPAVIADRAA